MSKSVYIHGFPTSLCFACSITFCCPMLGFTSLQWVHTLISLPTYSMDVSDNVAQRQCFLEPGLL